MADENSGLPYEYLSAIGAIINNFSFLEYTIAFYCNNLINPKIPGTGFIITSEMSFRNLVNMLATLFKHAFDNEQVQEKIKGYLKRIDECAKHRNLVAHSIWTPEFDSVKEVKGEVIRRVKYTAKREVGLDLQWENYTLDDLTKISDDIKTLNQEITEFFDSVFVSLEWIDDSDAGKSFPMKIDPHINEHNGKTYYMPKPSSRENEIYANIEAYMKKQKEKLKKEIE